jgi:pyruvate formate lyase activating enzyme
LRSLLPHVQAVNLDLKSLSDAFYREWCHCHLAPVQQTARLCREAGVHLELTCLLIPGENSAADQVGALAQWVAEELGRDVPLHLSAYYPCHKMDRPPAGESVMREALAAAEPLLDYVYLGNTRLSLGRDTLCPGCGHVLVERLGYQASCVGFTEGACSHCARPVDLVLS